MESKINSLHGNTLKILASFAFALVLLNCGKDKPTAPPNPGTGTVTNIVLAQSTVNFSISVGTNPGPQAVTISNSGSGSLSSLSIQTTYAQNQPTNWVNASLSSTTTPATLNVSINSANLAIGTFEADVLVSSSDADNSPQKVKIVASVSAPNTPIIVLSESSLSFSAVAGQRNPDQKIVGISNGGPSSLTGLSANITYDAGQPTNWLSASLGAGTAPAQLIVRPTTTNMAAGNYNATISVLSSVAGNSPQTVRVTYSVTSVTVTPTIHLNKTSLSFSAITNGSLPMNQSFTITNSGNGTLNWSVSDDATWVTESPAAGNNNSQTVTVSVNTTSLPAGSHNAIITVSSSNASNSPQTIGLAYTIASPTTGSIRVNTNTTGSDLDPTGYVLVVKTSGGLAVTSSIGINGFGGATNLTPGLHEVSLSAIASNCGVSGLNPRMVNVVAGQTTETTFNIVCQSIQTRQLTIINRLSRGGSDGALRVRIGNNITQVRNDPRTERLSKDSYCQSLPGLSVGPGRQQSFDLSQLGTNYSIHIGLGLWDNSFTCWEKKMWTLGPNLNDLWWIFAEINITHPSDNLDLTIDYDRNGVIVAKIAGSEIPFRVSVNADPVVPGN